MPDSHTPISDTEATLDPALRDFIFVTEVDEGQRVAEALFRRKYGHPAPTYPHHLAVFHRDDAGRLTLVHYLNFLPQDEILLIGGACTDGDAVRAMPPRQRESIHASGGLMLQATRFGLRKFAGRHDAVFGHCGDARSFDVLMQAGFQPVEHPHLLVYWPRLLDARRRGELIENADALGAF